MVRQIPACLSHLPVFKGLPIPYFTAIDAFTREPNFRAHGKHQHRKAVLERLCGVCGKKLDYWIFALMGPNELKIRQTYMPAMHRPCLIAAMDLCPFLAYQITKRLDLRDPTKVMPSQMIVNAHDLPPKPDRFALCTFRSYEVVLSPERLEYVRIAPPKEIEWWTYVDGELRPERQPAGSLV